MRENAATPRGVTSELKVTEMQSCKDRTVKGDLFSFVLILLKIMIGLPFRRKKIISEKLRKLPVNMYEHCKVPRFILEFVSVLIKSGLSTNPPERLSFDDVSEALKKNYFRITDGVG
jgi:hypothetical protein